MDRLTSRRRWLVGAAVAAGAVRSARAAPAPASPPARQAAKAAAPSLALGALFPFSGTLGLLGDESFRGLELATDARNAAGGVFGHTVRLVRGDASDPAQAVAEANRLIGAEHVAAIFGSGPSGLSLAASQPAELAGVPFFELGAPADAITARGFKYLFRSCPTATQRTALSVDAVPDMLAGLWHVPASRLKLAILHVDTPEAATTAGLQAARAKMRGLTLSDTLSYAAGTTDMGPTIQRLRGDGAEVVLHTGTASDIALLYRGLAAAKWQPRMIIGAAGDYALGNTMQAVGAGFAGTLDADVTQYKVNPAIAPGVAALAAAYLLKYGAPPRSGQSLASYAGATLFYDAMARAGAADKDKLRAAVLASDVPAGGTVAGWGARFDETGQNLRAAPFLMQWRNGAQVTVFPGYAAVAPPDGRFGA
jgi:branched-chain amino acid transport system substrate-binding protein